MAKQDDEEVLESMIDRLSLSELLGRIADICTEKAIHIRENWQDEATARFWEKTADRVARLADQVDV